MALKGIHFGGFIRSLRVARGWTVRKVCELSDITQPSWFSYEKMPTPATIYDSTFGKIAIAFDLTPDQLDEGWRTTPVEIPVVKNNGDRVVASDEVPPAEPFEESPVAPAGIPVKGEIVAGDAVECFSDDAELEQIPMSLPGNPRAFALRILGNSMEPEFRPGDCLIVEPIDPDNIQPGDDVVISCDGEAGGVSTFKRVEKIADGILYLRPLNNRHKKLAIKCSTVIRSSIHIGMYRAKKRA
jgi:SOS-response transcriptional repressor LexA